MTNIFNRIKNSKWTQNVSYVFMGKIIAMLFYQFFDIVIARKLSIDAYSEWAFFFSILSILFYIGWLGINTSAKVKISTIAEKDSKNTYIKTSLATRFIASFVVCVVIVFTAPYFATLLGYPNKYPNLLSLIYIGGFIVFINSYIDFFKSLYQALESFRVMCLATIIEYGGYFIFAYIFLSFNCDVTILAVSYLIAGVITVFFNFILLNKKSNYHTAKISFPLMKDILKYALPMALISIGSVLLAEIDIVMLGILGAKSDVSVYSISKRICDKAIHVNEAIIIGTVTSLAIINKENYKDKIKQFQKINLLNILASIFISGVLFLFGIWGINILYGEEYGNATGITLLLIPYYIILGISNLYGRILDYHGKAWKRCVWFIVTIISNIFLNYILIPSFGAKGAAWATIVSLVPYTAYTILTVKKLFTQYK